VFGRFAITKIDGAVKTMLLVLHDAYLRDNMDPNHRYRSIELLLSALSVCRPTQTDRNSFANLNLQDFVTETGKQTQGVRKKAKEVLKKFGTSEYPTFLCQLFWVTERLSVA
jgi:hypothetical protein